MRCPDLSQLSLYLQQARDPINHAKTRHCCLSVTGAISTLFVSCEVHPSGQASYGLTPIQRYYSGLSTVLKTCLARPDAGLLSFRSGMSSERQRQGLSHTIMIAVIFSSGHPVLGQRETRRAHKMARAKPSSSIALAYRLAYQGGR